MRGRIPVAGIWLVLGGILLIAGCGSEPSVDRATIASTDDRSEVEVPTETVPPDEYRVVGSEGTSATLRRRHGGDATSGTTFYEIEIDGARASWGRDDVCRDADSATVWYADGHGGPVIVGVIPKWFPDETAISQEGEPLATERFSVEAFASDVLVASADNEDSPAGLVGAEESMSRLRGCDPKGSAG